MNRFAVCSNIHSARFNSATCQNWKMVSASLASLVRDVDGKTPIGFSADVFGGDALTVGNLQNLAMLANVPTAQLQIPANGTETILLRLVGNANPISALQKLDAAANAYQSCYQELCGWFPEIQIGQPAEAEFLTSQREAVQIIRKLGLQNQSLESVLQLTEKIEKIRKAVQAALDVFQNHFEPWPLLPPENLDQIHQGKKLFYLLITVRKRPQNSCRSSLSPSQRGHCFGGFWLKAENFNFSESGTRNESHFAICQMWKSITVQRRELRSLAGIWWRWFSGRYHKARKKTRVISQSAVSN